MSTPTLTPAHDWRAKLRASKGGQLLVLLVTAALLVGGWWLVNRPDDEQGVAAQSIELTGDQSGEGPVVGKPAPDFTAKALDGSTVSLSALKGHPVWLSFGATWCTACRAEAPDIQAAWQASKAKGTRVVDVYVGEDAATVKDYVDRLGLGYTHIVDPRTELGSTYKAMGLPTHVFIDAQGVVRKVVVGGLTEATIADSLAVIGG